jgi:hypothetical protein
MTPTGVPHIEHDREFAAVAQRREQCELETMPTAFDACRDCHLPFLSSQRFFRRPASGPAVTDISVPLNLNDNVTQILGNGTRPSIAVPWILLVI